MRITRFVCLILALTMVLASSSFAGREKGEKKLPVGAYITQAKIEILSGDTERVEAALKYLTDLFKYYGPHSEGFYWVSQIYVDYIEKESGPRAMMPYVEKLMHYTDSLRWSCDNEEIKEKYRKGCSDLADECDSIVVKYEREFYNAGVERLDEIKETNEDMKADPDSASQAYYTDKIGALRDTAQAYFELTLAVDSTNTQAWIGSGSVLSTIGDLSGANDQLIRGLNGLEGEVRENLIRQISNNYLNAKMFQEAIPYLREYVDAGGVEDLVSMFNLSLVYYRCDMIDSQIVMLHRVLAVDSQHVRALVGLGGHSNGLGLAAADSSKRYTEAEDDANTEKWKNESTNHFTQASSYLARAFAADTTAASIAKSYGLALILLSDYQGAIEPFSRMVQIEPEEKGNWTNLADCYVKIHDFDKSARAYEKAVELDPDDKAIWRTLKDLYKELNETENIAKAEAHLK